MSKAAKLTQPIKYFGGKHYLADKIIALMPPHLHYVEPFFGGGSVLLAKDPDNVSEVVNDLNGDLMTFWKVLADRALFQEFIRFMEATPFSEPLWNDCDEYAKAVGSCGPDSHQTLRASVFFVRCRQSHAGQFKGFATLTRNRTRRRMNEQASAWLTAVEGLPAIHERLKRVVILNRDALDVIRQQDGEQTVFYLDPPYLHETRESTSVYAFECKDEYHAALLDVLATIKGKFLLSGYPSEMYAAAEERNGWRHVDFFPPNNASCAKAKERKIERVWMNY